MKDWLIEVGAWVLVGLLALLVVAMLPCVLNLSGNAVCLDLLGE